MSVEDDVKRILEAEKQRPGAPPDVRALVAARIRAGGAGGAGGAGAEPARDGGGNHGKVGSSPSPRTRALSLAGAVAIGLAGGAALHARFADPKVVVVQVPAEAPAPPPAPSSPAPPPSAQVVAPAPSPAEAGAAASGAVAPRIADVSPAATRERALLERARSALARGDSAACLDAVHRHEREFPHGAFSEERDVLAIEALARSGHAEEARARAVAFRATYSASLFEGRVDRASPP